MKRKRYIQIFLIAAVFLCLNLFPSIWGSINLTSGDNSSLHLELYPKPPQNTTLLNSGTTLTILIRNQSQNPREFRFWISNSSENLFINGRDGTKLPCKDEVGGGSTHKESLALIPTSNSDNMLKLEIKLAGTENNLIESEEFILKVSKPKLSSSDIENIASKFGFSPSAKTLLIPKYRRYWHPELDETEKSDVGYVWLVGGKENSLIVEDESGKLIKRNVHLPWKSSAPDQGITRLWNGSRFVKKPVPTTKISGDNSYNLERFELYFAERENKPAWVTRRIFYWTSEELVKGSLDEVPDTERVEAWISAENGEFYSTISDYHYYAFRYSPIKEYTIQTLYHCPLTSNAPLLWSDFTLGDYANVYPLAKVKYDHLGLSEKVHPIDRVLSEKIPLIKRNLLGLAISIIILIIPYSKKVMKG